MLASELQVLVRHMEWADSLVWKSVLALPEAHSDTHLHERLHHVHAVQWAYLQIWSGESVDWRDASSFADLRAIHSWARQYYCRLPEHFDTLEAEALERQIEFPWAEQLVERWGSGGSPHPATMRETILQITSHTTHHRAQVCTRVRELGGEPPLIDFIAWIWMGKPAPAWEEPPTPPPS